MVSKCTQYTVLPPSPHPQTPLEGRCRQVQGAELAGIDHRPRQQQDRHQQHQLQLNQDAPAHARGRSSGRPFLYEPR